MATAADSPLGGTYEKAIALYKLKRGAWTPLEEHIEHNGQQHWLCIQQLDDGSGDAVLSVGIGPDETPMFSHIISKDMKYVNDEDAMFMEIHISEGVSYGCYFSKGKFAHAFKSLWDSIIEGFSDEKSGDTTGKRGYLRLESYKMSEVKELAADVQETPIYIE